MYKFVYCNNTGYLVTFDSKGTKQSCVIARDQETFDKLVRTAVSVATMLRTLKVRQLRAICKQKGFKGFKARNRCDLAHDLAEFILYNLTIQN